MPKVSRPSLMRRAQGWAVEVAVDDAKESVPCQRNHRWMRQPSHAPLVGRRAAALFGSSPSGVGSSLGTRSWAACPSRPSEVQSDRRLQGCVDNQYMPQQKLFQKVRPLFMLRFSNLAVLLFFDFHGYDNGDQSLPVVIFEKMGPWLH